MYIIRRKIINFPRIYWWAKTIYDRPIRADACAFCYLFAIRMRCDDWVEVSTSFNRSPACVCLAAHNGAMNAFLCLRHLFHAHRSSKPHTYTLLFSRNVWHLNRRLSSHSYSCTSYSEEQLMNDWGANDAQRTFARLRSIHTKRKLYIWFTTTNELKSEKR